MDALLSNVYDYTIAPITNYYNYLFIELADPRTNDWLLVKHPIYLIVILCCYWHFVYDWGPKLMENRKPFEFKKLLIVYNFLQVILSTYIFYEALDGSWLRDYNWKCEPVDYSMTPHALRVARGVHMYYVAKITELLDTVFFVLRKKQRQITFLHMYHHSVMPLISWGAAKYYAGGHGTFIGLINSFVHIIMYTYYMLTAMGPKFQSIVWWKKHITRLQMFQFCCTFLHNFQLFFYDCGYPKFILLFTLPNSAFFYFLFSDFYKDAYKVKPEGKYVTVDGKRVLKKQIEAIATTNGHIANGVVKNGLDSGDEDKKRN